MNYINFLTTLLVSLSLILGSCGGHISGWNVGSNLSRVGDASGIAVNRVAIQEFWVSGKLPGFKGARTTRVTSDGNSLYAASRDDNMLLIFDRDQLTGTLTLVQVMSDVGIGIGTAVDGLAQINDIAISPDEKYLYTTSIWDDALLAFSRDTSTGKLSFFEAFSRPGGGIGTSISGLDGANYVAISPDGTNLYVTGYTDQALVVFDRDMSTGRLTFLEAFSDVGIGIGTAQQGLGSTNHIAISPDGANVYVGGATDDSLVVFDRNLGTGALTFNEAYSDVGTGIGFALDGLNTPSDIRVSPDGEHLYIVGSNDHTLIVFDRNPADGKLAFVEYFSDIGKGLGTAIDGLANVSDIIISEDGEYVYTGSATDDALLVFDRNTTSGALTFVEAFSDAGTGIGTAVQGLDDTEGFSISPDGIHLYVLGNHENSLLLFDRNPVTGTMTHSNTYYQLTLEDVNPQDAIYGVSNFAISPDGNNLYTTGRSSDSLLVFTRNTADGKLTFLEGFSDDGQSFGTNQQGLNGSNDIAISSDGAHLYVTSTIDDALLVFDRNTLTGELTFKEAFSNGGVIGAVQDGLDGAYKVVISPNGQNVYVASQDNDALLVFSRDTGTGLLTIAEIFSDVGVGIGTARDGLDGITDIEISNDGETLYTASRTDQAVLVFNRNTGTGLLTFVETFSSSGIGNVITELDGATDIKISNDDSNIYVVSYLNHTLISFDRNPADGSLTFLEKFGGSGTSQFGLTGARNVTITDDDSLLYVGSNLASSIIVFTRNPADGTLTYLESFADANSGTGVETIQDGLKGINDLMFSPDGENLYVAGFTDNAILVFDIDATTGRIIDN